MARNEEKQLGRLNRLLLKQQKDGTDFNIYLSCSQITIFNKLYKKGQA